MANRKLNLATGVLSTGDFTAETTGPDQVAGSGLQFASGQGLVLANSITLASDFLFTDWIENPTLPCKFLDVGNFFAELRQNGPDIDLALSIDALEDVTTLNWDGTGWVNIIIKRTGASIFIIEDNVEIKEIT